MISEYQVRGRRVVAQEQAGAAPTLLMLHGAGGNHHSYDELLPHLGRARYLVPALPGRCGSEGEALPSVGEVALWLLDFADAANLGAIVVCGHSYGGALAMELALVASGRMEITGLVLMATGARLRVNPMILRIAETAVTKGEAVALGGFAFRSTSDRGLIARTDAALAQSPPEAALADWRAADGFDRMQDLAAISQPTLILAGDEDQLTPLKYARYMAEGIPNASLSIVPGAGHMLPVEHAAEAGARLNGFVAGLRAR